MCQLAPDQLSALKQVATIESIGSSTHIEGSKLSDREVEKLLSNLSIQQFSMRDEQEVAGYSGVMTLIFQNYDIIPLSESYIQQLTLSMDTQCKSILNRIYIVYSFFYTLSDCTDRITDRFVNYEKNQFSSPLVPSVYRSHRTAALF